MISADVGKMFSEIEPCYCSGSQMELGSSAGRITWENALKVADDAKSWLKSKRTDAYEGMREWARETGAWDAAEIAAWSKQELLALFVQNVASELREHLDADNLELKECVAKYASTEWEKENSYPTGSYYVTKRGSVCVDYYCGI
jgi:hypothetical protein